MPANPSSLVQTGQCECIAIWISPDLDANDHATHHRRMTTQHPRFGDSGWPNERIRDLEKRLNAFRSTCRVTTLTEVQGSKRSPFHLLVSCVISLRTKDEVTHEASKRLYELANTPAELAELGDDYEVTYIEKEEEFKDKMIREMMARAVATVKTVSSVNVEMFEKRGKPVVLIGRAS